jgi:hypothetical protein
MKASFLTTQDQFIHAKKGGMETDFLKEVVKSAAPSLPVWTRGGINGARVGQSHQAEIGWRLTVCELKKLLERSGPIF